MSELMELIFTRENRGGLIAAGIIILICLIIGVQLLRGKWLMLISGYNTLTPAERAQYDGRALGRIVGIYTIVIALLVAVTVVFGITGNQVGVYLLVGLMLVLTIVFMILSQKFSKTRKR